MPRIRRSAPRVRRRIERESGHQPPLATASAGGGRLSVERGRRLGHRVDRLPAARSSAAARVSSVPGGTVQPMIAVNPAGNPHQDYAIMKVVQQLRQYEGSGGIVTLTAGVDFSTMSEGEKLYIVSHGRSDTGALQNIATDTLIGWLNRGGRGVPDNFGGIVILSCYSGEEVEENDSLAQQVAEGLNVDNKTVEGARGFAFGSPKLATTGKSSVLSSDRRVFYQADDIDAMKDAWAAIRPNHAGGVLTEHVNFLNQYQTVRQNLVTGLGNGGRADGWIDTYIKRFKSNVKRIEVSLAGLLAGIPGDSVAAKIRKMEDWGTGHRVVRRWNILLQQQYDLFHNYYLWSSEDDAYASFDS